MANLTGDAVVAMAQKQAFDPWVLPDTFTLYAYAPEDIRSFLHPHWHSYKALHPAWYYFLGLMYLVIGTCAVAGNAVVLKIFSRFPALRTPANLLVMNLAVSDFLLMLALFPECVYNFFLGGPWRFGDMGCQIHAFLGKVLITYSNKYVQLSNTIFTLEIGACFGYNQIFTLTMISYDRYNVIVKGFSGTPLTFSMTRFQFLLVEERYDETIKKLFRPRCIHHHDELDLGFGLVYLPIGWLGCLRHGRNYGNVSIIFSSALLHLRVY